MSDQHSVIVSQPVAKFVTAWSGVGLAEFLKSLGIATWGDAAAAAACMYSLLLILEWAYKKLSPLRQRIADALHARAQARRKAQEDGDG